MISSCVTSSANVLFLMASGGANFTHNLVFVTINKNTSAEVMTSLLRQNRHLSIFWPIVVKKASATLIKLGVIIVYPINFKLSGNVLT